MILRKLVKPMVLIMCVAVIAYALFSMGEGRGPLDYYKHIDDTAFSVDGKDVTFKDLAFYILYEEGKIEEQAKIYNPDYTKDYWNIHTNDTFIQLEAKDVILGMAEHDELFYQLAVKEGMDTLTMDEESDLAYAITDFWEDRLDVQMDNLPCDKETINQQMKKAAIAEKYQDYLASTKGPSVAAYNYDGYYYSLIKEEHQIKINKKLWDKLVLGDITLEHSKLNYINGLTDADKKKSKD